MKKELAAKYDHKAVESHYYADWLKEGYFTAGDKSKDPYCIVIPPPNVTGKLHLGHAWDTTLQDIIARYKRLQGYDMLWLPGMDHAGIATQAKVDARLKEQGISRYDIGREKFLEHAWAWKEEYASTIRKQWAKMGLSLDYSRERFTLDEGLSHAVRKVFSDLYHEGLIYQGERIINWDPEAKTALSNIEVIHKEIEGAMYYFRYRVVETGKELVIATTRPETMFADQAIFVHPDDERYKDIVGLHAINPANGEALPIMADDYIDMSFGTAVMKCTPAHDPNDFMLAKKYDLPMPICMNPDGTMNEMCGKYAGMDRFACRKALVADFEAAGVVDHIEKHMHQVGHSERTGVIVEPYLSRQWFVKMKPLAEAAIKVVEDGEVKFVPDRFAKTYLNWMENVHDWCISRQLWWGHQIPVWYCTDCGHMTVSRTDPTKCEACHSKNIERDPDVLDTWFSSALWPFSTLGWPEKTEDLDYFYPTDVLVTGYDIIFFWVARMIFSACEQTKKPPFHTVFIHGLVRDDKGRKMSKSLGNGIDPLEIAEKYGADALRFNLITGNSPGNDMRFYTERCEAMRNFANKIWNASRFLMMNLTIDKCELPEKLELEDKWILSKLNRAIREITENMDRYELGVAAQKIYDFIWDDYCDWYIELTKTRLQGEDEDSKIRAQQVLCHVLTQMLKLLHPFMPFITEEIWQALPHEDGVAEGGFLMLQSWPVARKALDFPEEEKAMELIMDLIRAVRTRRSEMNVPPSKKARLTVATAEEDTFRLGEAFLKKLAYASEVDFVPVGTAPEAGSVTVVTHAAQASMPMAELVDLEKEKARMEKELKKNSAELQKLETKLQNPGFVNKAPEHVVKAEQERAVQLRALVAKLEEQLQGM